MVGFAARDFVTSVHTVVSSVIEEIFYINERDDKLHVRDGKISKNEWKRQFKGASAYGMYCKKDMRPYIRQYVKIPDRIKIKVGKYS